MVSWLLSIYAFIFGVEREVLCVIQVDFCDVDVLERFIVMAGVGLGSFESPFGLFEVAGCFLTLCRFSRLSPSL